MALCPDCGAPRSSGDAACPRCGATSVPAPVPTAAPRPVARAGAQRGASATRLDPEARREVMARFFRTSTPVVRTAREPRSPERDMPRPPRPPEPVTSRAPRPPEADASRPEPPSPPHEHARAPLIEPPRSPRAAPGRANGRGSGAPLRPVPPAVPGSGDWWQRRLHSSDVEPLRASAASRAPGTASTRRVPPPPPPPIDMPALAGLGVGGAAAPDVHAVARDVTPAHIPRGRLSRRANHVTAVTLAVVLIIAGALVVAQPTADDADDDAPPAVAPVPSVSGTPSPSTSAPAGAPNEDEPAQDTDPSPEGDGGGGAGENAPPPAAPAQLLVERINDVRRDRGRSSLVVDADLERVALQHVGEMVGQRRLFHSSNDVLAERVTDWRLLAESIGVGPSVPSLMEAFMRSDIDRRNLLDKEFFHVGVGAVRKGKRLWVTVLFTDRTDPGTTLAPTLNPTFSTNVGSAAVLLASSAGVRK
ncbi:MAG: CAP domain-containing protein [Actinomycetota bacterium]